MSNLNSHNSADHQKVRASAFELSSVYAYESWRNAKLALLPVDVEALKVEIANPYILHEDEIAAITQRCATYGVAIYQLREPPLNDKSWLPEFGRQLGLVSLDDNLRSDEDSVSSLQVRSQQGNQYIPYTNRPLSWHTDGYYNTPEKQIRTIVMHCASPAASGGVNSLLDHEQLYIALRERNPAWIEALMHPQAMTIPANVEAGVEIREARTGPVFSVDKASGNLHMRYSARKRNIEWRDDVPTREAVEFITEKLADETIALKYRLDAGQGIICNNILHNRSGFEDSDRQQRLMYRARYYEQIVGLNPAQNA